MYKAIRCGENCNGFFLYGKDLIVYRRTDADMCCEMVVFGC